MHKDDHTKGLLLAPARWRPQAAALGAPLALRPTTYALERFGNGELHLTLAEAVRGVDCYILSDIMPPEERLCELLILSDTLKKEGAAKVTALLPYLSYTRHDRAEAGKSRITALLGRLCAAAGLDRLVTVDVHSQAAADLFPIPLVNLSPAALFAAQVQRLGYGDATLVAPDRGALARCQAVAAALPQATGSAWIEKQRHSAGITHTVLHGTVGAKAVVVDDILDSGKTTVSCCERLRDAGATDIVVVVTHGLFSGTGWQRLWELGVRRICCSDSVPLPEPLRSDERIGVVPLAPLFVSKLQEEAMPRRSEDNL